MTGIQRAAATTKNRAVQNTFSVGVAAILSAIALWPAWGILSHFYVFIVFLTSTVIAGGGVLVRAMGHKKLGMAVLFGAVAWSGQWLTFWNSTEAAWAATLFNSAFYMIGIWGILSCPDELPLQRLQRWVLRYSLVLPLGAIALNLTSLPEWQSFPASLHWPTIYTNRQIFDLEVKVIYGLDIVLAIWFALAIRQRFRYMRGIDPLVAAPIGAGYAIVGIGTAFSQIDLLYPTQSSADYYFVLSTLELVVPLGVLLMFFGRRIRRASIADQLNQSFATELLTPATVQTVLRRVLNDEELQLFYWNANADHYKTSSGLTTDDSDVPASGKIRTSVTGRDGSPLALIEYDASIDRHRPIVQTALNASTIALENAQLQATLQLQLTEVERSRGRIAEAAINERRRISRDLHDGIQQRLLAAAAHLGFAKHQDLETTHTTVEAVSSELHTILLALRDLTHGIHPPELRQFGLRPAVEVVAERLPLNVSIGILNDRFNRNSEATAYYVICEALTNVVKHADAEEVRVDVAHDNDGISVSISDNGHGGANTILGTGLLGLHDRVQTIGGTLHVESTIGLGTTVRAILPCCDKHNFVPDVTPVE